MKAESSRNAIVCLLFVIGYKFVCKLFLNAMQLYRHTCLNTQSMRKVSINLTTTSLLSSIVGLSTDG